MTKKIDYLRKFAIYFFTILTLACAVSTVFFAISGDASQRNESAVSALVGMLLVLWLRKDQESEIKKPLV
ncbi:hypothetical protein [Stutzerimonas tarimensis]|uniref:Lipoprotein n=1 Tax=Stutzerimonas tarimensis TaxID=1507735 RepID=A0ABV7T595_9GAMM